MFKKLVDLGRNLRVTRLLIKNRIELIKDPIVYVDGINYNLSPDTIKNKLIFGKAFKAWVRLWDMTDCGNKLRLPGVLKWKGVEVDLMKEGELTKEEYGAASALWVGLFSLMYRECKEKYESGKATF